MRLRVAIYFIISYLSLINFTAAQSTGGVLLINDNVSYVTDTLVRKIDVSAMDLRWSKLFNFGGKVYIPYMYRDLDGKEIFANHISTSNNKKWIVNRREVSIEEHNNGNICFVSTIFGKFSFPHYLFYGKENLCFNYQKSFSSEWIEEGQKVSVTLNRNFEVVGAICGNNVNSQTLIYNSKDAKGKNHIFSISSDDGGRNWSSSSVAVKHNVKELRCWCVAVEEKKEDACFMILSDNEGRAYYSTSKDKGTSWSYPLEVPIAMGGKDFKLLIHKGHFVLLFKVIDDDERDKNDIFIWRGGRKLNRDTYVGRYNKLIDNPSGDETFLGKSIEDIIFRDNRSFYILVRNETKSECNLELHLVSDIKFKKKQTRNKLTR